MKLKWTEITAFRHCCSEDTECSNTLHTAPVDNSCKCLQKDHENSDLLVYLQVPFPRKSHSRINRVWFQFDHSRKCLDCLCHVQEKGSQTVLGSSFVVSFLLRFNIFVKNRRCTKFFWRFVFFMAAVFNHRLYSGSRMARPTRVPAFSFSDLRVTSSARIVGIAKVAFLRILIGFADIRSVRCEAVNARTLNIT